ncbi:MAG: DUF2800 domain-containing protein [Haliea sp.]|nr:MAG: DUF2800 domain-containing protein [Haliea sp.]
MTDHAFLPPSGAGAWVHCGLWPTMQVRFPEPPDAPASMEGTATHWAMAEMLLRDDPAEGSRAPNGMVLTGEMLESADVMVDAVRAVMAANPDAELHVEQRVVGQRIHPSQNWGTIDVRIWSPSKRRLWLFDFKHGHGIVEVHENWQLINYAALACSRLNGLDEQHTHVEMIVVQPRAHHPDGPVRRWSVVASDLRAWWNRLEMAAEDATSVDPKARPGDYCEHCTGRHACEALQRDAYRSADRSRVSLPLELPLSAASLELQMLEGALARLDARVSGLRDQVRNGIERGQVDARYVLERSAGRRAWTVPPAQVIALGKAMKVPLAKPLEPITPTQALKAGIPEAVLAACTDRPAGTVKLVPFANSAAARVFN